MDTCVFCRKPFKPNEGSNGTFACCRGPAEYRAEVERIQKMQREQRRGELKREIARLQRELEQNEAMDSKPASEDAPPAIDPVATGVADSDRQLDSDIVPKRKAVKRDRNGIRIV